MIPFNQRYHLISKYFYLWPKYIYIVKLFGPELIACIHQVDLFLHKRELNFKLVAVDTTTKRRWPFII